MTEYTDCMRFSIIIPNNQLEYLNNKYNFNQQVKQTTTKKKNIVNKQIKYNNEPNDTIDFTLENIKYDYWHY
tara:strand:- start:4254 stop:4469 length:216 start_codon:yes stop_codon:yes gene_type:complete